MSVENQTQLSACRLTGTQFGNEAANYSQGRKDYPRAVFDWIKEQAGAGDFLDIGCGNARATRHIQEFIKPASLTGFDFDESMLAEARKNTEGQNIPFIQGNVQDLAEKLPGRKFTLVTAFTAFHWFCEPVHVQAIHSVLDATGLFIAVGGSDGEAEAGVFHKECKRIVGETIGRSVVREKKQNAKEALEAKGLFTDVKTREFSVVEEYTREQLLAKLKSHSFWTELSSNEQEQVWPKLVQYADSRLQDGVLKLSTIYKATVAKPTN